MRFEERLEIMGKILVVSILLTLIYSWEEFKSSIKFFLRCLIYPAPFPKTRPPRRTAGLGDQNRLSAGFNTPTERYGIYREKGHVVYPKDIDRLVSMSISLVAIPIGLTLFLETHPFTTKNLLILAAGLLGIALAAMLASAIARRFVGLPYYQQIGPSAFLAVSLASLVSPSARFLADFDLVERKALSKLALFLSLPALLGLALKFILGQSYVDTQFLPALDLLIEILVMALFVRVTISFLEQHLHSPQIRRFSHLFRILLGVLLSAALIFS